MPRPSARGLTERGPDPRTVRSRAAALRAVRELLVEQGLPGVTHAAVAARSGVGRTTLYRHWPDTTAMLQDAVSELVVNAAPEPTGELRADLIALLESLRTLLHQPASERAMRTFIERSGVDPAFTRAKEHLYIAGSARLREILTAATDRGELDTDIDEDLAVGQLAGPLFYRRLLGDREVTADYVRNVVDGFLRMHALAT
ncbi:TetR/AcrR family transcriptional regulator [Nocardia transvalensis]|uniref:TetR/AcrR family transcriptional regulator n=1 Tax=Nocardia transvalensis TaxID=37333 RepID=UPI001895E540|nr:TetR/AcrR family transcriptional regulator [Nocardia transvalensis]MBF6330919.1 TetR/AcrR family transcriptional regulator [Nocardia transvalensis]